MGIVTKILTPAEIAAAKNNASSISNNANAGIIKSNQFTFFAAFDGTRKNMANGKWQMANGGQTPIKSPKCHVHGDQP